MFYFQHQANLQFSEDTDRVSDNLTQFWDYLPGDSIRAHSLWGEPYKTDPCSSTAAGPKYRMSPVFLTYWLEIGSSQIPSLGLINMLEWLTKLWKTLYRFISKEYNSGVARWRRHIGQGIWKGVWSLHALFQWTTLLNSSCVHQPRSSPILFFGFLWKLHCIDRID